MGVLFNPQYMYVNKRTLEGEHVPGGKSGVGCFAVGGAVRVFGHRKERLNKTSWEGAGRPLRAPRVLRARYARQVFKN